MKFLSNPTISYDERRVARKWVVVDAEGKTLGRLATRVAAVLRGKTKPQFTPHTDVGDFVVVINADKIKLAPKRAMQKEYYSNSGYPGAARFRAYGTMMEQNPSFVIEHAVRGMLPHNRLGARLFKKLKVYAGAEHPHGAQHPEQLQA